MRASSSEEEDGAGGVARDSAEGHLASALRVTPGWAKAGWMAAALAARPARRQRVVERVMERVMERLAPAVCLDFISSDSTDLGRVGAGHRE